RVCASVCICFCFTYAAPTALYTLSLHDALPICRVLRPPIVTQAQAQCDLRRKTSKVPAYALAHGLERCPAIPFLRHMMPDDLVRDRKSTRLNSSHVKISYAVFCLKKKINTKYKV